MMKSDQVLYIQYHDIDLTIVIDHESMTLFEHQLWCSEIVILRNISTRNIPGFQKWQRSAINSRFSQPNAILAFSQSNYETPAN